MKRTWRLRGQAMHEYLVIPAIVLGVFGLPAFDGKPLVFLRRSRGHRFARFLASISPLPGSTHAQESPRNSSSWRRLPSSALAQRGSPHATWRSAPPRSNCASKGRWAMRWSLRRTRGSGPLTRDLVAVREVPVEWLHRARSPRSSSSARQARARQPARGGEPLVWSQLVKSGDPPPLSAQLAPGRRAPPRFRSTRPAALRPAAPGRPHRPARDRAARPPSPDPCPCSRAYACSRPGAAPGPARTMAQATPWGASAPRPWISRGGRRPGSSPHAHSPA